MGRSPSCCTMPPVNIKEVEGLSLGVTQGWRQIRPWTGTFKYVYAQAQALGHELLVLGTHRAGGP